MANHLSLSSYDSYAGYMAAQVINNAPPTAAFMREVYQYLEAYYRGNGLYTFINEELTSTRITSKDIKPLRDPANRTVEFYAAKLWPGTLPQALPVVTDNDKLPDLINQIWQWSNWNNGKQRMARFGAIYGDWFIKVNTRRPAILNDEGVNVGDITAVYHQVIEPQYVSEFDQDERGFLTYARLDIPQAERQPDGTTKEFTYTEVWNKDSQIVRVWRHEQGLDVDLNRINADPVAMTFRESHGDDFIPIVYQQFRDDGDARGGGAFSHVLDKIDEANRQATRLAQILFRYNRAMWAILANSVDKAGRPMPPPSVSDAMNSDDELQFEDDTLLRLPGMSDIKSLVPSIDYAAGLSILQDMMGELKSDLPELAYYDIRQMSNISGVSARLLLDDAISRLLEARGNGENAMIRANQMALTIGKNAGLEGFEDIGDFASGDLNHTFADRDVIPLTKTGKVAIMAGLTGQGVSIEPAAKYAGIDDATAAELAATRRVGRVQDEV